MSEITAAEIAAWRAVVADATPGPWEVVESALPTRSVPTRLVGICGGQWLHEAASVEDAGYLAAFDADTMRRILDALEAGERARAALAWYGDQANYRPDLIMTSPGRETLRTSAVVYDAGDRARAALAETTEGQ